MGRKVKIRASYNNDAMFISRLQEAISKDSDRPQEWKTKTIAALRVALNCLLEAPIVSDADGY